MTGDQLTRITVNMLIAKCGFWVHTISNLFNEQCKASYFSSSVRQYARQLCVCAYFVFMNKLVRGRSKNQREFL